MGARWVVRNNLFRNIRAPEGQLAGPAVLMWNRGADTLVEGNLFLNVQYGIALGLDPGRPDDHAGGIVRNNVFHRSSAQSGDVGIVTEGGGTGQAPAADGAEFPPIARNVSLAGPFAVSVPGFLVHTWTGGEPRGAYLPFLAAARAGALADGAVDPGDLLAASVATFVFP